MRDFLFDSLLVANRHWILYKKQIFANMSPTIIDPLFFLVAFGLGLGHYMDKVQGLRYIEFIAPGLAITSAFFTSIFETSYQFFVRHKFENIYLAILTTPIGVKEIIAGELIWVTFKAIAMSLITSSIFTIFGLLDPVGLLLIPIAGALIGLSCGSIGLICSALVKDINQFQTVYSMVISPMFFFSGAFFPVSDIPQYIQSIFWISPVYHGVRFAQESLWKTGDLSLVSTSHFPTSIGLAILLTYMAYRFIYPKLYN